MSDRELLASGFNYDLWANRKWLTHLENETERSIFQHILGAQEIWLSRCKGVSPATMPTPNFDDATLNELNAGWLEVLDSQDANRIVAFRRTTGESLELPLITIARHVVNHGTYHRGELRGLRRARGDDSFPETDLAGFAFAEPVA